MTISIRRFFAAFLAAVFLVVPVAAAEHASFPDETIRAAEERTRGLSFVTNDGQSMTLGGAVEEICNDAAVLAKKVNPALTEQELGAMRGLIARRLYLQQYGSDRRFLGDHGIRHIYGNIQRARHFLKDLGAGENLAVLVAHVYHDVGYTDPDILLGVTGEDGTITYASKYDHDLRSWDFFTTLDLPFWQRLEVFSPETLAAMREGVALHNTSVEDYAKRLGKEELTAEEEEDIRLRLRNCLDVNRSPITAGVHLADKLALSEREKMPLVIARTPEITGLLLQSYGARLMKKAVDDEVYQELSHGLPEWMASAAQNGPGRAYCLSEAFQGQDINPELGKRFLCMNPVQTDSTCLTTREMDGVRVSVLTLKVLDFDEARGLLGEKLAGRQLRKLFRDLGVDREEDQQACVQQAFAEGGVRLPGTPVIVEFRRETMAAGDERQATRQAVRQAAEASPVFRLGLTFRELRDICRAGDASDAVVLRMESFLSQVGAADSEEAMPYLEKFRDRAGAPAGERDAGALWKAFQKCLRHSPLQEMIENLRPPVAENAAA